MAAKRPTLRDLDDYTVPVRPLAETAATPGSQSQVSTSSGYSVSSTCQFLKGKTEKDEYVRHNLPRLLESKEEYQNTEPLSCGIGKCRPSFFQRFTNIKAFVTCMSLLLAVTGTLSTGYLNSVLTTIEKRFEIGSSISGLIAASYEFGSLAAVVFISYFGGRRHIPKWIGRGIFFMGLGSITFALPHFFAEKYTVYQGISQNNTDENICKTTQGPTDSYPDQCIDKNAGHLEYVLILISAQILIGTGGTPILTLGTTYVDNHVAKEKAPAYLAFIYASGVLGPVLGYGLGALLLQYYVDVFSYEVDISPSDPQWIGAWWGGFIICGGLLLCLVPVFLSFPRVLVNEKKKLLESKTKEDLLKPDDQQSRHSDDYGKTIKGGIGIPGAVVGILVGGFILKRFQLQPKGAIQLTLLLNALALVGFLSFLTLGCKNLKIAGATIPYHTPSNAFNSTDLESLDIQANLTSTCNMDCACSDNDLEPICGINGITYFSPCHAGCTRFYSYITPEEKLVNFSGCTCIMENVSITPEVIMSPVATNGPCKSTCQNLLPFLILLVLITTTVAGTQMPLLMVTLRSVHEEERCFALGVQFVILRLFAHIPSPIMFGNTIDTACLLWRDNCGSSGSCLVYDIEQFRYKYVGISAGLKLLGFILFSVVCVLIHIKGKKEERHANLTVSYHNIFIANLRLHVC
ncbi:hypothetical protein FSP39_007828 [Pinctada imbricata]|uniref:Kazal-like domain-containing protein n=1 Tax=Pinctada imbricata TaxID=66713 RepID=A0AA89BN51_PINIB|nr:hypothetical protein FSP39_007828 [Pinctada imbricata]